MAGEEVAKKEKKRRRRETTTRVPHRAKFALCAKHCRGDAQCMSNCLKG